MLVENVKKILGSLGILIILIHPTIGQNYGPDASLYLALFILALLALSLNKIYIYQLTFICAVYLLIYILDGSAKILALPIAAYAIFCLNQEHPEFVKTVLQGLLLFMLLFMFLQKFTDLELVHYFSSYSPDSENIKKYRPVGIHHSQVVACQVLLLFVVLCIIQKYRDKLSAMLIGAVGAITGATAGLVAVATYLTLSRPYKIVLCIVSFFSIIALASLLNFKSLQYNYSFLDFKKSTYSRVVLTNSDVIRTNESTSIEKFKPSIDQVKIIKNGLLNPVIFILLIAIRGGILAVQFSFSKREVEHIRILHLFLGLILVYLTQVLHFNAGSLFFAIGIGILTALETRIFNELNFKKSTVEQNAGV